MRTAVRPLMALAVATLGVMLGTNLLQPVLWLQVTTADGTRVACSRVTEDMPVTLAFTHSMFGGFVEERYRLRADGTLGRQHIVTENAAAAEYYATDGAIRRVEEGYEVIATPFAVDRLVIRVDARGDHRLSIGSVTYPLYDQLVASTQVTLEGKRTPLAQVPQACRTGPATMEIATGDEHER